MAPSLSICFLLALVGSQKADSHTGTSFGYAFDFIGGEELTQSKGASQLSTISAAG
jgi:hypothetical protein